MCGKVLLRSREGDGIWPALYIQLFNQRLQVGQERFSLGESIHGNPSQAAALKSFLGMTCCINYASKVDQPCGSVDIPSYYFWKMDMICHFSVAKEFLCLFNR